MSQHFDILSHFKTQMASPTGTNSPLDFQINISGFDRHNSEHRLLLLKIAIKIADLANCCKPYDLYIQVPVIRNPIT